MLGTLVGLAGVALPVVALIVYRLRIDFRRSRDRYGWTGLGDLPIRSIVPLIAIGYTTRPASGKIP